MPSQAAPSTANLFFRTLPYVFLRMLVYLLFGFALTLFLGLMGAIGFLVARLLQGAGLPLAVVGLIGFMGLISLWVLAQRYVLYLVKIGHVAVITEILLKGDLPSGTNQVAYGKDKVIKHFGSASTLFLVDGLVAGTVRQVMNWLSRMAGCLGSIPGLGLVVSVARRILSLAANYIDEAVMSYILRHEGQDVWQTAADGVVLYAQSWRKLLGTAARFVVLVAVGWTAGFTVILVPLLGVARTLTPDTALQALYGFIALVISFIAANLIRWMLVDPLATVAMVACFNRAIEGEQPSYDLKAKIAAVSGKFRQIMQRTGQTAAPAGGPPVAG
ncbi:MAG: hypothetical protein ACUVRC_06690 [Desulfotomaculales bacterium]